MLLACMTAVYAYEQQQKVPLVVVTSGMSADTWPSLQVVNHKAIVKFALRGAGEPGPRPVSAPLADPTGVAAEQHTAAMDAAMRHVAHALLVGVDEKQVMENALQVTRIAVSSVCVSQCQLLAQYSMGSNEATDGGCQVPWTQHCASQHPIRCFTSQAHCKLVAKLSQLAACCRCFSCLSNPGQTACPLLCGRGLGH